MFNSDCYMGDTIAEVRIAGAVSEIGIAQAGSGEMTHICGSFRDSANPRIQIAPKHNASLPVPLTVVPERHVNREVFE